MDDEPKLGRHGGPRRKGERASNGSLVRHGSSRAYIEARLRRDFEEGCPEAGILLRAVHDGTISAFAAACQMNYCKRPEPNGRGSENAARTRDWRLHRLFHPKPDPKAMIG